MDYLPTPPTTRSTRWLLGVPGLSIEALMRPEFARAPRVAPLCFRAPGSRSRRVRMSQGIATVHALTTAALAHRNACTMRAELGPRASA